MMLKRKDPKQSEHGESDLAKLGRAELRLIETQEETEPDQLASSNGALIFALALFMLTFAVVNAAFMLLSELSLISVLLGVLLGWLVSSSVHVVQQWEKLVILRVGKLNRVSGPGLVFTWPIIEHATLRVDQRIRATDFGAEETLTADLVPLAVDAVLFWMVWDAEKACVEVGDFNQAVILSAQTALRDAIGRGEVAEIALRRNQLDKELQRILEEKVAPWGISILSVEIKDILVPEELQDAMSAEAKAEQQKKARIILMEAERDIAEMLAEMDEIYAEKDLGLRLRAMHLLYESVRETGGTVVIPNSFSESFGDLFPDSGRNLPQNLPQ